ncbi:MAG TPA: cyclase family protein [Sphingomicrobium sp.]|nr:cyclase family protein [Sphingomicrobium sp.]
MAHHSETAVVDLSHVIDNGMTTYPGLPGPRICDFWDRESSAQNYDDGSSFHIARIDMVANTGTYLDAPFHRFETGFDLADLPLRSIANIPGIIVQRPFEEGLETRAEHFANLDVRGKAVLVHTGWDQYWRRASYGVDHPFLASDAADWLIENGAVLVGIDSNNIDDTRRRERPVHTRLLGAAIPICEHLTRLADVRGERFQFSAVPARLRGVGSFPVRAYALVG